MRLAFIRITQNWGRKGQSSGIYSGKALALGRRGTCLPRRGSHCSNSSSDRLDKHDRLVVCRTTSCQDCLVMHASLVLCSNLILIPEPLCVGNHWASLFVSLSNVATLSNSPSQHFTVACLLIGQLRTGRCLPWFQLSGPSNTLTIMSVLFLLVPGEPPGRAAHPAQS